METKLTIEYCPSPVIEGAEVILTAQPPSPDYTYRYTWRVDGAEVISADPAQPETRWKAAGAGPHSVEVFAEWTGPVSPPDDALRGQGRIYLAVQEKGVTASEVQTWIFGTCPPSGGIKENLDSQLGGLTGAVNSIAAKLPEPGQALAVQLQQSRVLTSDLRDLGAFFGAIRNRTEAIRFPRYNDFINRLLCEGSDDGNAVCGGRQRSTAAEYGTPPVGLRRSELEARPTIYGVDAYNLLRVATEAFLIFEAGIVVRPARDAITGVPALDGPNNVPGEASHLGEDASFNDLTARLQQYLVNGRLPYLNRIVEEIVRLGAANQPEVLPYCDGILRRRFSCPSLIELIWSYWHEEGMLVQTLNAITLRFQNRRGIDGRDPLANLAIDPLRPLNNLLWGYVQDEMHRLSLPRRTYEYDHHYGLTLFGKAVPKLQAADSRSKFLNAFHNLLYLTSRFYHEDADTTVIADAFPLLNALREVHLLLAEGAHNQFGDLPWTARVEMLIQQYLLARPEMREFLRGRAMVPYQEAWMGQVDTMKRLQGWTETNITNFYDLGVFGEQLLLSIRYHDWSVINSQDEAKLWARYWKAEVQRYIHSYRAVTGVDLTTEPVDATPPWVHLSKRSAQEQRRRVGQG
jgi:hypothetical protein